MYCAHCYADVIQTNSEYTYGNTGLYRIPFPSLAEFTNYPTGKTILGVAYKGGYQTSDPSYALIGGCIDTYYWGIGSLNTTYRVLVNVFYTE